MGIGQVCHISYLIPDFLQILGFFLLTGLALLLLQVVIQHRLTTPPGLQTALQKVNLHVLSFWLVHHDLLWDTVVFLVITARLASAVFSHFTEGMEDNNTLHTYFLANRPQIFIHLFPITVWTACLAGEEESYRTKLLSSCVLKHPVSKDLIHHMMCSELISPSPPHFDSAFVLS